MGLSLLRSVPEIAVGVELRWLAAGEQWQLRVVRLRRVGGAVSVVGQPADPTTLAELAQQLGLEAAPIALVLTGRGLLFRTLTTAGAVPTPDQLATLLPGGTPTDFVSQCEVGPSQTLVAIIRRTPVEALLADFVAAGLWVISVQFGPLVLTDFLTYISAERRQSTLPAGPYQLSLAPGGEHLAEVVLTTAEGSGGETYPFGTDAIPTDYLLAYAAGLSLLTDRNFLGKSPTDLAIVRQRQGEWQQRRLFYRLRLAVPVSILLLLLVNLGFSQYLQTRYDELSQVTGDNQRLLAKLRGAEQTLTRQQRFLSATGWTKDSYNSLCADRLAATIPAGIQLLILDIQPQQTQVGESEPRSVFRTDVVSVKGQCANSQQFNTWLQRLSSQPWVRAVRDQNFAYEYTGGAGTFTFTLLLNSNELVR